MSTTLIACAALVATATISTAATGAAEPPTCESRYGASRAATIVGSDGDDVIHGTDGPDVIVAGDGDDLVIGTSDQDYDLVCGGPGDDVVRDFLQWTLVRGGPGRDSVRGAALQYGGDGIDNLEGSDRNDVLVGGDGSDTLAGHGGQDNLVGGRGDDTIDGGDGSDFIAADPGDDHIDGGPQAATDPGQSGGYILRHGDWLYWTSPEGEFDEEDIDLFLEPGVTFRTPLAIDLAEGSAYSKATGRDRFTGIESATGTAADDVLRGDGDANYLHGYGGADRLVGRAGDDTLYSGKGADRIDAGSGDDDLWVKTPGARVRGGAGRDWTYWWGAAVIDLGTGEVRGRGMHGSVGGIEDVASDWVYRDDGPVIRGDGSPNELSGRRVYGRGGADKLWGRFADGGSGVDACRAETKRRCELPGSAY